MNGQWFGRKLNLQISEPFEFGIENNSNTLKAVVEYAFSNKPSHYLIVKTQLTFQGVLYEMGVLRSRYSTEEKFLNLIDVREYVVVAISFIPCGHPQELQMIAGDSALVQSLDIIQQVPDTNLKDWAHFIGIVSVESR